MLPSSKVNLCYSNTKFMMAIHVLQDIWKLTFSSVFLHKL